MQTIINATAPARICDIGGWTDTWFAGLGRVFNIAIHPGVEVQVRVDDRKNHEHPINITAENFGLRYSVNELVGAYNKLPLIEAALRRMTIPKDLAIHLSIYSAIPPGASTGTSAAVSVAIIAALDRLTPGILAANQVARCAHAIESEDLGLQSGVQDQLCSAYGGMNLIEIEHFPTAMVSPIHPPPEIGWELEERLSLIYVGQPHQSSAVHEEVIARLGDDARDHPVLCRLRDLAEQAKDRLCTGDLVGFGAIMDANTRAQRELHPGLVGPVFERAIAIARDHDCLGVKVNGAGGDGGSITVLGNGINETKRRMWAAMEEVGCGVVPIRLAHQGLRIWTAKAPRQSLSERYRNPAVTD